MINQDFIEKTKIIWQPYYGLELTDQDAGDIITNWSAYIHLLSEWAATKQTVMNPNKGLGCI